MNTLDNNPDDIRYPPVIHLVKRIGLKSFNTLCTIADIQIERYGGEGQRDYFGKTYKGSYGLNFEELTWIYMYRLWVFENREHIDSVFGNKDGEK